MGAGTNIQHKLVALHHLDAPWRPRDIEQRDGRILRQGNGNPEVSIFRYVTEGSFDAYLYQTLETKARFIQQVMSGTVTVREAEDVEGGALNYAEIKAIASGNPLVLDKIRIDTEVRKLDVLRAAHWNQQFDISPQNPLGNLSGLESELRRLDRYAEAARVECERNETALADYREQLGRPFEQDERLRALLAKQADINRSLDLDKSDTQIVDEEKV